MGSPQSKQQADNYDRTPVVESRRKRPCVKTNNPSTQKTKKKKKQRKQHHDQHVSLLPSPPVLPSLSELDDFDDLTTAEEDYRPIMMVALKPNPANSCRNRENDGNDELDFPPDHLVAKPLLNDEMAIPKHTTTPVVVTPKAGVSHRRATTRTPPPPLLFCCDTTTTTTTTTEVDTTGSLASSDAAALVSEAGTVAVSSSSEQQQQQKDYVLSKIPAHVKDMFGRVGFAKWKRTYLPALLLSPYQTTDHAKSRTIWMKKFRTLDQKQLRLSDDPAARTTMDSDMIPMLVFWYGEEQEQSYYAVIQGKDCFIPYHKASPELLQNWQYNSTSTTSTIQNNNGSTTTEANQKWKRMSAMLDDLSNYVCRHDPHGDQLDMAAEFL